MNNEEKINSTEENYEPGMQIQYDELSKVVLINFRGLCLETVDLLRDRQAMIVVAEDYCRSKGWAGRSLARTKPSLMGKK